MNSTSDLLARYLQAIGDHLPAATREDVAAGPATNLQKLAAVNHWMNFSFRIVLAFVILDLIVEGWKLRPSVQTKRLVF
jgi:hypothetical protein